MSLFLSQRHKTVEYIYPFLCVSKIIITGSVLYDADVMYFASGMHSNVYFNKQKLKKIFTVQHFHLTIKRHVPHTTVRPHLFTEEISYSILTKPAPESKMSGR